MTEAEKDHRRRYCAANKEKHKVSQQRYCAANKEKRKETQRKYWEGHKTEVQDARRQYYAANKEKIRESRREYQQANLEKVAARRRLTNYGMTEYDWNRMNEAQGEACKICLKHELHGPTQASKPLHVDHDHKTGKVRGLLCQRCNRGLGHFFDSPDILFAAAQYLNSFDPG